jgi:hypothetical protein
LTIVHSTSADETTPQKPSLNDRLLDDLNSGLLDGLDDLPPLKPRKEDADSGHNSVDDPTATPPLDQLGQGEDVELGKSSDPLTRIGEKMRTAERLINQKVTSMTTQRLQTEILADLEVLIEKQTQSQSSSSTANKGGQANQRKTGDGQKPAEGTEGAEDSTSRIGKAEVDMGEVQSREEFLEKLWGNLPERFLQQIRNAGDERFLPKYEKLIEDYYKRLAEDRQEYP